MPYTQRHIQTLELTKTTVRNHGAKDIADKLGIATGTLYADIDSNSIGRRRNKLGFLDYLKILEITGDITSLVQVCADLKHLCLPLPKQDQDLRSWLVICASMAKEGAEAVSAMATAIADGKITRAELVTIEKECLDALTTIGSAYVSIKAMLDMEGGQNG